MDNLTTERKAELFDLLASAPKVQSAITALNYLLDNPTATDSQAAKALGVSQPAINMVRNRYGLKRVKE